MTTGVQAGKRVGGRLRSVLGAVPVAASVLVLAFARGARPEFSAT